MTSRAICAAVVAAAAVSAGANGQPRRIAAGPTPYPPPVATCDAVVLRPRSVSWSSRIVFGRVTFSRARVYQIADHGGAGLRRYFAKVGLYVRAGRTPVTLAVPRRWRTRAGISWGTGVEPVIRIAGCPSPPNVWNGYAGGFYVREPACVPLIVRVRNRSTLVRFGLGRSC